MATTQSDSATSSAEGNRLVGWLVSYGVDTQGAPYEVRSGRTLITADADTGKKSILVTDSAISSPHAAVRASSKHKVLVQDIFSENGTFLMRSGSSEETPITGPMGMDHGDWI